MELCSIIHSLSSLYFADVKSLTLWIGSNVKTYVNVIHMYPGLDLGTLQGHESDSRYVLCDYSQCLFDKGSPEWSQIYVALVKLVFLQYITKGSHSEI